MKGQNTDWNGFQNEFEKSKWNKPHEAEQVP